MRAEGADFVVAVTHTDRAMDYRIVRSRLVDVLLTGHDHDLAIAYDGKTVMVESNEEGNYVTAIDFVVEVTGEGNARELSWTPSFRVNDSAAFAPDPEVDAKVQAYEALLSRELDVPSRQDRKPARQPLGAHPLAGDGMGDLVTDAIRAVEKANAAIFNGGGIRGNTVYEPGTELTRRNILTELPFGNRTVVTEVTGRALREALENGFSQADRRAGRFPQVSGLKVFVDLKRPPGTRVVSVDCRRQARSTRRRPTASPPTTSCCRRRRLHVACR